MVTTMYNTKINATITVQVFLEKEKRYFCCVGTRVFYLFVFLRLTGGKRETKGRESLS